MPIIGATEFSLRHRRMHRAGCRRRLPGALIAGALPLPEVLQRPADRGKGKVVPGDLLPREELDLEALGSRLEAWRRKVRAIDHLHLADAGDIVDGEQTV